MNDEQSLVITNTVITYDRGVNEYRVLAYDQHDRRFPDADYFTPDRDDAIETAKAMRIDPDKITSVHLARLAKQAKPHIRYAGTVDDTWVVAWHEEDGRWIRVAGKTINGGWASLEHELLIDGQPLPLPQLIEV